MVIDKRDRMDRFALNDGPIPDLSHVKIRASVSCFFEIVVQGNIKQTELICEVSIGHKHSGNEGTRQTCVPRALT
jgi:hypothetical protein